MFVIDKLKTTVNLSDFISQYRDVELIESYCKVCAKYEKCWTCPPFDFCLKELISKYNTIDIYAHKIDIDSDLVYSKAEKNELLSSIYKQARVVSDENINNVENIACEVLTLYAGSCIICPTCSKCSGLACIYPDKSRYSLESIGFDVSKITSGLFDIELKWGSDDRLPEYLVLISAVMSK